jgi:hypothetical protein
MLPSLSDSWRAPKQLKIYDSGQLIFWQDNLALARKHGNMKLMKECVRICRRFEIRRWIKKGINLFFDYKG